MNKKKFYAQNGEDEFIWNYINTNNIPLNKKIIEIGALTGTHNSNSRFFIESCNWSGIMVEPNPISFNLLKQNTKNFSSNLILENLAITENDNVYNFSINKFIPGHSKLDINGTYEVNGIKFDSLIKKYPEYQNFDILSIDVEGHEIPILKNIIQSGIFPTFIISEHFNDEIKNKQDAILNCKYNLIKTIEYNSIWILK